MKRMTCATAALLLTLLFSIPVLSAEKAGVTLTDVDRKSVV